MALEAEIQALGLRFQSRRERWRMVLAKLIGREKQRVRAYQACLLGEDGEFSPAAVALLADLARVAGMQRNARRRTAEEAQYDEGARMVVLHLLGSVQVNRVRLQRLIDRIDRHEQEESGT